LGDLVGRLVEALPAWCCAGPLGLAVLVGAWLWYLVTGRLEAGAA